MNDAAAQSTPATVREAELQAMEITIRRYGPTSEELDYLFATARAYAAARAQLAASAALVAVAREWAAAQHAYVEGMSRTGARGIEGESVAHLVRDLEHAKDALYRAALETSAE